MNYTELQMELRSIENHISKLHDEVEKMKPKTEAEKEVDFETINKLARRYPIMNHSLAGMGEADKLFFVISLSYISLIEQDDIYIRLLYLTRLSFGSGLDIKAEEIYKKGLAFKETYIDVMCESLADYKYTYLVEAFILVNLSGGASTDQLAVISDIAKLMECDKEEIRVIAQVAKAKLLDDINVIKEMPVPSENRWSNCFADYIPNDWIIEQRKKCNLLCTNSWQWSDQYHPCEIKSCLPNGSIVKKGELICNYLEKVKIDPRKIGYELRSARWLFLSARWWEIEYLHEEVENTVLAPCDGLVFLAGREMPSEVEEKMNEFLEIYVVSYFDNYDDFCNWYGEVNELSLILDKDTNKEKRGIESGNIFRKK